MTALDQMPGGRLEPSIVGNSMRASDRSLRETAWWVAGRHPDWGVALYRVLRDALWAERDAPGEDESLVRLVARFATGSEFQTWIRDQLIEPDTPSVARVALLRPWPVPS